MSSASGGCNSTIQLDLPRPQVRAVLRNSQLQNKDVREGLPIRGRSPATQANSSPPSTPHHSNACPEPSLNTTEVNTRAGELKGAAAPAAPAPAAAAQQVQQAQQAVPSIWGPAGRWNTHWGYMCADPFNPDHHHHHHM